MGVGMSNIRCKLCCSTEIAHNPSRSQSTTTMMQYTKNDQRKVGTRTAMQHDDISIGEVSSLGNSVADDIGHVDIAHMIKILDKKGMDADLAWDTTVAVDTEPYKNKKSSIFSWMCCLTCD